ncbi:MAG: hypothetical protein AAGE43_05595 [Pseudomonadota bacterium]
MCRILSRLIVISLVVVSPSVAAEIKRTANGKPDLTGTYDTGTLTPTQRPEWLGETEYLFPWMARLLNWTFETAAKWAQTDQSDPDREAPPEGGDGNNVGGAGGVGGYNLFYIDPGSSLGEVNGRIPTSIIYEPENGRYPETRDGVSDRLGNIYQSFAHENTGEATWLDHDGPGPFDGPESLAPSERCLISFGSTVPTISSLYNNYKRIVQTETHVMILQEMVHDARIIRLDSEHSPEDNRKWLGDSIGRWEDDTLVVETRNFRAVSGLPGADENLQVVERFTLQDDGNLYYDFTVTDETVWSEPWSGRYVWQSKPDDLVYEYACHEANYAMGNILRGARLLESEYEGATGGGDATEVEAATDAGGS